MLRGTGLEVRIGIHICNPDDLGSEVRIPDDRAFAAHSANIWYGIRLLGQITARLKPSEHRGTSFRGRKSRDQDNKRLAIDLSGGFELGTAREIPKQHFPWTLNIWVARLCLRCVLGSLRKVIMGRRWNNGGA